MFIWPSIFNFTEIDASDVDDVDLLNVWLYTMAIVERCWITWLDSISTATQYTSDTVNRFTDRSLVYAYLVMGIWESLKSFIPTW